MFALASLRSSLEKRGSFHWMWVYVSPVSHLLSGGGENGGLWLVLFGWAAANKSQCNIEAVTEAIVQTGSPSCASERARARLPRRLKHTPNSNPRKKREWRLKRERKRQKAGEKEKATVVWYPTLAGGFCGWCAGVNVAGAAAAQISKGAGGVWLRWRRLLQVAPRFNPHHGEAAQPSLSPERDRERKRVREREGKYRL